MYTKEKQKQKPTKKHMYCMYVAYVCIHRYTHRHIHPQVCACAPTGVCMCTYSTWTLHVLCPATL